MAEQIINLKQKFKDSGMRLHYDSLEISEGEGLDIIFFQHASLGFIWREKVIYVDPLSEYADYRALPRADLVLITHDHYDHLDKEAVEAVSGPDTIIVGSSEVGKSLSQVMVMKPGDEKPIFDDLSVTAVPAYNTSADQLQFHPKDRGDNGYIISFAGYRVYVAGDTEPTEEMKHLGKIDVAFLPVNQPYTMTVEQAASAAKTIRPAFFYPYHTTDTDIEKLRPLMSDASDIEMKIYPMP